MLVKKIRNFLVKFFANLKGELKKSFENSNIITNTEKRSNFFNSFLFISSKFVLFFIYQKIFRVVTYMQSKDFLQLHYSI